MSSLPHFASRLACIALVAIAVLAAPTTGEAQRRARLDAQVGAHLTRQTGDMIARPATRLQLAIEAAGPLEVGVYVQAVARDLPLKSPLFGGGLSFAVRPRIPVARLRPLIQASAGYAALPGDQMRSYGTLDVAIVAGLAVELTDVVALEVRGGHHWLLGLPDAATLHHRHWSASAGLSFSWNGAQSL
jgi:hypothetical protein